MTQGGDQDRDAERLAAECGRLRSQAALSQERFRRSEREVARLARELTEIKASRAYRWALRVRRFRNEFLRGDWGQRREYAADMAGRLLGRGPQAAGAEAEATAGPPPEERVEAFLERAARAEGSGRFVVMFSSTTFIQPHRGNRPMRLTEVMVERGIPVVFSYWRWRPTEPIPPDSHPLLLQSPIDQTMACMGRIARHPVGDKRRLFVASFPDISCARWLGALHALGWTALYDCRDEWEEFHKVGAAPWYQRSVERYVAGTCDATLCTARALQEKMRGFAPERRVELSPNALDSRFLAPENRGRIAPREGEPVVGYFGHLTTQWFDWDALRQAAEAEPGWCFEIIGHGLTEEIPLPPNVLLLGPKDAAEINRIAQRWRAALIPFKPGPLSDAVDPIKVYEYLALGLPVVSLTMAQIAGYPYVFQARGGSELRDRIAEAMSAPLERAAIEQFLAANRWEDRVDQMLAVADEAAGRDPLTALAAGGAGR